ncbi:MULTISPECIES: LysR substrate-binding domain-containing protein [Stappiaceae]|jgi:DNA-binding transcriptional LysR family regulator|uniref:Cyn operon transcriptional activator n=1 Tax=Roseibium aggregatum TaxID=187304 RepID=A0A0M6Y7P0_9HYPH|nr:MULTISPECIES: LysR substrate-binding domain-containing protein [Stappiaceae]MEC9469738.1 LysR substrate-binding domain-containing protein [Pseudomonadota bacterium]MBO6858781.1 LysR family transcriptional regulator [Roseibium sp.]MEE2867207.1 LysR substrate-binding domain-containing protein [Pseudomonadota bacterium]NKX63157.1 LysR family transcriptional regulator [Labrenzia sp. 5N]CTQ44830.1 Cyn operon transcriptional activator [Roseibium aggregatum]
MNLSFRQLQTFVQVMRTGSVSEAGRALGRTQPAVSAMIAGLEREVGFQLFERERGRLVPKPEAHYFLEEAEFLLERLTRSTRTLQDIGNLEKGKLRIACNPAASSFFMPRVLANFLRDKPDIEASLMMRSSPVVTDWIASQQYDIGFAETPEPRRTIISEVFALPGVCAVPKDDPLARKKVITPADLDGKPMAMLFDDHSISEQTRKAFNEAGARLNKRFELRTFLPALQLVSEGLCYTICEGLSAISHQESFGDQNSLVFRPFKPECFLNMSLLTPANRPLSLLVESFAEVLRAEIKALVERAAGLRDLP